MLGPPISSFGFHLLAPAVLPLLCLTGSVSAETGYDPLRRSAGGAGQVVDAVVDDGARARAIPVRLYLPPGEGPAPVILFSHGLGGSRESCRYLGEHWSARGYLVVAIQHPGSDEGVWRDVPRWRRMAVMKGAASPKNFQQRVADVPAVLDQLEAWHRQAGHVLHRRVDISRVGMSGHSFGAVTTQAVSGQSYPLIGQRFTDPRIDAAVALSPSSPARGSAVAAFGEVAIPWMLMTGTNDTALVGDQTVASRQAVYPAVSDSVAKYELLLQDAEHSAFTERALPGDTKPRNSNHHVAVLAFSTAFWDGYLRGDAAALHWLHRPRPSERLAPEDRWRWQVPQEAPSGSLRNGDRRKNE